MKRMLSTLLALCLLLSLTPAALGAEDAETTFQYTWSQEGDNHTVTRVDAQGDTVMEEGIPAFTHTGTSPWNTIIAIYDDAEVAHQVFSFVLTLTTDVTLVGEPKGGADAQAIAFQDGTVCWELNGQTLTLQNLNLGAGKNNVTTFRNGAVAADSTTNHNMLYAKYGGELILDDLTVSRADGGTLVSSIVDEAGGSSSVTIQNSTLTTGVLGMDTPLGNALLVNGENASMALENTTVTGHAPIYPTASVTGGALTAYGDSAVTATADNVAAAIVRNGDLYLNGGKLIPGAGGYAYGGRTNGRLHLSGGCSVPSVELRSGDQIVDDGYTGGQGVGDLLVTGCTGEEAVEKFQPSAQNTVGLAYAEQEDGTYAVVAAEEPVKADDYTMTQDQYGRYTVTGAYGDGSVYVLVNEEPSFQTTIHDLFNDVQGTGATIKLGGNLSIAGTPKGDGSYPTTGVGEGWITWDLQRHTLNLDNLCMIALIDGVLTVQNGTVTYTGDLVSPHAALFGAQANGKMILEDVAATRADGGRLLGAYPADGTSGAVLTAKGCTLDNDRDGLIQNNPDPGSNAIVAGENSGVSLIDTTVKSGASWAVASVYGTLNVDENSAITSTETTDLPTAAVSSIGGTVYLTDASAGVLERAMDSTPKGALIGDVALRDNGGSHFYLSGNATAATIEVAGPGVVDATGYTGGDVTLTYTGNDVLMDSPLVTGCGSEETARKFKLTTGAPANIAYKAQPDGTWAAVAAATPLTGEVTAFTKGTVYSISSKEEMERLAALVNSGNSGEDCFFLLTADVNLEGGEEHQWPSIGRKGGGGDAPFAGVLDGGGHTVSGLYINRNENTNKGLFAYVASGGGVRNLTISGRADVVGGGSNTGGLVGYNEGRIEKCTGNVSVSGGDGLGGLVSVNSSGGAILNCVNNGAVEGASNVGGIVGYNSGTVTGCTNNGAIRGTLSVGGVTGQSMHGSIARCQNNGSISSHEVGNGGQQVGGIAGHTESATIEDCVNTGDVTSRLQRGQYIGGIVGYSGGGTLKTCYNMGAVSCAGEAVGGVVGYMSSTTVTNCVSLGLSVSGGKAAGRVVGTLQSGTLSAAFARSDLSHTGGAMTVGTAKQDGVDGESITLSGDWQKTAFAGWDFDTVWNEGSGDTLPTLKELGAQTLSVPYPARTPGSGTSHSVSKPDIKVSGGGTATADGKGHITATPDEGYVVDKVIVTDRNGKDIPVKDNGDGTYAYTQPSGKVTITVTFKPAPKDMALPFTDVAESDWFYESVQYVYERGLINGTSGTTFSPYMTTSRSMIVTILRRLESEPEATVANPFTDVPADAYYAKAVVWAAENGIAKGYPGGKFGPNAPITREQLAVILYRYTQFKGQETPAEGMAVGNFSDSGQISAYAREAMRWALGQGIINGKGNNILDPKGSATRAETAEVLFNLLK